MSEISRLAEDRARKNVSRRSCCAVLVAAGIVVALNIVGLVVNSLRKAEGEALRAVLWIVSDALDTYHDAHGTFPQPPDTLTVAQQNHQLLVQLLAPENYVLARGGSRILAPALELEDIVEFLGDSDGDVPPGVPLVDDRGRPQPGVEILDPWGEPLHYELRDGGFHLYSPHDPTAAEDR